MNNDIFLADRNVAVCFFILDLKFDYKNVATSCRRHAKREVAEIPKDSLMFSVNDCNTNKVELSTEKVQERIIICL